MSTISKVILNNNEENEERYTIYYNLREHIDVDSNMCPIINKKYPLTLIDKSSNVKIDIILFKDENNNFKTLPDKFLEGILHLNINIISRDINHEKELLENVNIFTDLNNQISKIELSDYKIFLSDISFNKEGYEFKKSFDTLGNLKKFLQLNQLIDYDTDEILNKIYQQKDKYFIKLLKKYDVFIYNLSIWLNDPIKLPLKKIKKYVNEIETYENSKYKKKCEKKYGQYFQTPMNWRYIRKKLADTENYKNFLKLSNKKITFQQYIIMNPPIFYGIEDID